MYGPIELVVAAFKDENKANEALKDLKRLDKRGVIDVINAAVLVKDQAGKAFIKEMADPDAKRGALFGGIRCFVVGAMPLNYHCIELSKIVNGDCRAARPAPPPNAWRNTQSKVRLWNACLSYRKKYKHT